MNEAAITNEYIKNKVGVRKRDSHKGDNGRGLLFAGSDGFYGAALMASAAAERAGIGTLKTASEENARSAFSRLFEVMFCSVGSSWDECDRDHVLKLISEADVIGAGPGIGKSKGVEFVVESVLESGKNAVLDADALNVLSASDRLMKKLSKNIILTPHIKEMSRLTKKDAGIIKNSPRDAAAYYAKEWGCNVLLKGACSIIASPDGKIMKNTSGNAGLAKGGSGDVLTGLILAMLGQKLEPFDAACAGAYILGASADNALDILQERMLMARDVIDAVEKTLEWK